MLQRAQDQAAALKQAEEAQAAVRKAEPHAIAAAAASASAAQHDSQEEAASALSHVVREECAESCVVKAGAAVGEGRAEHAEGAGGPSCLSMRGPDSDGVAAEQAFEMAQLDDK